MYAAINRQQKIVYASQAASGESYYCPKCYQKVSLVMSKRGKAYFRHPISCQPKSQGESNSHQLAKTVIGHNLASFNYHYQQEFCLTSSGQIADLVVFKKDQKIGRIIEYQQSQISAEILSQRQQDYESLGYSADWILANFKIKRGFHKTWLHRCLNYSPRWSYHFWTLDPYQSKLFHYYHLPLVFCKDCYQLTYQCFPASQNWLKALEGVLSTRQTKLSFSKTKIMRAQAYSLQRLGLYRQPHYRPYLQQIYLLGIGLENLPAWIFQRSWVILAFDQPAWWVWIQVHLAFLNKVSDLKIYFKDIMNRGILTMKRFPLISDPDRLLGQTCLILEQIYQYLQK